jgi:hypothetical protein
MKVKNSHVVGFENPIAMMIGALSIASQSLQSA